MTQCQELGFLSGTGDLKKQERIQQMIPGVGGHPLAEQMKMSSVLEKSDRCLPVRAILDELGMNSERVWRIVVEDLRKHGTEVAE